VFDHVQSVDIHVEPIGIPRSSRLQGALEGVAAAAAEGSAPREDEPTLGSLFPASDPAAAVAEMVHAVEANAEEASPAQHRPCYRIEPLHRRHGDSPTYATILSAERVDPQRARQSGADGDHHGHVPHPRG